MRRRFLQQGAEVLEQHHLVRDRGTVVAPKVQCAELVGRVGDRAPLPRRLARDRRVVVQDGKAVILVDDKIDFDAGAERHAFEDAPAGEDRITDTAAGAVPFEEGAVTVADHRNWFNHDGALDR